MFYLVTEFSHVWTTGASRVELSGHSDSRSVSESSDFSTVTLRARVANSMLTWVQTELTFAMNAHANVESVAETLIEGKVEELVQTEAKELLIAVANTSIPKRYIV